MTESCFQQWVDANTEAEELMLQCGLSPTSFDPNDPFIRKCFYESIEWFEMRAVVVKNWKRRCGGKCERCNRLVDNPHVHHTNGLENDDYEVICPECHSKIHNNPYLERTSICKFCGESIIWRKGRPYTKGDRRIRHRCNVIDEFEIQTMENPTKAPTETVSSD